MRKVKGDLIQLAKSGEFDVIIHGCNCFNNMGAGIAKAIKHSFPDAYKADLSTVKGDKKKLGTISHAVCYVDGKAVTVVNAYTQYKYGKGLQLNYTALEKCMKEIARDFGGKGLRIAYPKIGCGLAGGDWKKVEPLLNSIFSNENHTLVIF